MKEGEIMLGKQYSAMYPQNYEWLWQDLLVTCEAPLLVGDSGVGKGYLVADIVAAVTTGRTMPRDDTSRDPASVIMIGLEEDAECTTIHKLSAAGADLTRVIDLSEVDSKDFFSGSRRREFTLQEDMPALRKCIREHGGEVSLVVLDPLSALSDRPLTATVTRAIMASLRNLAREFGISVLVVHHPVKGRSSRNGEGLSIKDRIGGSKQLTDAARLILGLDRDPETGERILSVIKSNISDDSMTPLRFKLDGAWPMHVEWLEELADSDDSQDIHLGEEPAPDTEAGKLLFTLRKNGVPMTGKVLAFEAGVKYTTTRVTLMRLRERGFVTVNDRGFYTARSTIIDDAVVSPGNECNNVTSQVTDLNQLKHSMQHDVTDVTSNECSNSEVATAPAKPARKLPATTKAAKAARVKAATAPPQETEVTTAEAEIQAALTTIDTA